MTLTLFALSWPLIKINSALPYSQGSHWYQSPEWWLVIVGFLTCGIVIFQSFAAMFAVNAARASTDAFLAQNRPWILVDRNEDLDKIQDPYFVPAERTNWKRPSFCRFAVRNFGQTPARIIFFKFELQIGESLAMPPFTKIFEPQEFPITPYIIPPQSSEKVRVALRSDLLRRYFRAKKARPLPHPILLPVGNSILSV
jgi:hypothetical protein